VRVLGDAGAGAEDLKIGDWRRGFLQSRSRERNMKTFAIILAASFCVATAALADDSCAVQATGKSLHGAALNSFAKKCCADQAKAQNLHGAAQTSFTKKCLSDAGAS
jgi:psiF repeat